MNETLAEALRPAWISAEELDDNYRPILKMVRELIGVIPNCNPILEIWPTAFRSFNLLVPNLLNLPAALVGQGAPKDLVGIAMYASSNAAECPYCTAHHCSFAIRRGADREAVLGQRSEIEAAVADMAESMARVPYRVEPAQIEAIERHLSVEDTEWIAMAVSLGGFLNKFMDAMGIPLEEAAVSDVQALLRPTGWDPGKHVWSSESIDGQDDVEGKTLSAAAPAWTENDTSDEIPVDGVGTYLRVIRQAPGAVRLEKGWTRGVSSRIGPVLLMLEDEIGYGFPMLGMVRNQKVVKPIATAIRDNLDSEQTAIGIRSKLLVGLVYAAAVGAERLCDEIMVLVDSLAPATDPGLLAAVRRFGAAGFDSAEIPQGLSSVEAAALMLAKAAAPSPAEVSEITIASVHPALAPDQIVEIVSWLALLQMMARLQSFLAAKYPVDENDEDVDVDLGQGVPVDDADIADRVAAG